MAACAAAAVALSTSANLLALCWFGLWMGMTSRSANLATLKTLLFDQVIPWFVIAFGTGMVVAMLIGSFAARGGPGQPAAWLTWWPLLSTVLGATLAVAKDAGFIIWSRNKLHSSLRAPAARDLGRPRIAAPPPAPPPAPALG